MKHFLIGLLTLVALVSAFLWWREKRVQTLRWMVYYGPPETDLKGADLVILQPGGGALPVNGKKSKPIFISYLSVGEAEESRGYWPEVDGKAFVLGENPVWKGAHRDDIRSGDWQALLLDRVIPAILAQGFDGLFLDTIETPIYLENLDPETYRGSKQALIQFVRKIKERYPKILLIPNNGLEFLESYGELLFGVAAEDLYTHYDFEKKVSTQTPTEISLQKEKQLDLFRQKTGKPVFNILYEASPQTSLAQYAIQRSKSKGYQWYLATVDLTKIGTLQK